MEVEGVTVAAAAMEVTALAVQRTTTRNTVAHLTIRTSGTCPSMTEGGTMMTGIAAAVMMTMIVTGDVEMIEMTVMTAIVAVGMTAIVMMTVTAVAATTAMIEMTETVVAEMMIETMAGVGTMIVTIAVVAMTTEMMAADTGKMMTKMMIVIDKEVEMGEIVNRRSRRPRSPRRSSTSSVSMPLPRRLRKRPLPHRAGVPSSLLRRPPTRLLAVGVTLRQPLRRLLVATCSATRHFSQRLPLSLLSSSNSSRCPPWAVTRRHHSLQHRCLLVAS